MLQLWWALRSLDLAAHRKRAQQARAVAQHALDRLTEAGWKAWRHEHAFTVVIKAPSRALIERWSLATAEGWSHIVSVPGVTTEVIDQFVDDLTGRSPHIDTAPLPVRRRWLRWLPRGLDVAPQTGLPPA